MARLFGVFATHSPESCPLNKKESREIFLKVGEKLDLAISKHNINRIEAFYMSVLEHQWIIILDADNAHDIETLCSEVGISAFSTVKIVPLRNFDEVIRKIS